VLLVGALAIYLRGLVEHRDLKKAVLAGLTAPVAFWAWLLIFVPIPALVENFYRYPVIYYPRPECRGLPTPWADSFSAILAPLRGDFWTGRDLVLIFGNLLAPILGLMVLGLIARSWRGRTASDASLLLIGALDLILFLEMRARSGSAPDPAVPFGFVSVAILIRWLYLKRPREATVASIVMGLVLAVAITSSVRVSLRSWTHWPEYDPLLGFTSGSPDYDFYTPSALDPIADSVHRYTKQNESIFVTLRVNRGTFANAPALYWLLDRPPANRFIEFNPCQSDRGDVQKAIVKDLERTNVVVQSSFFPHAPFDPPSTVLDDYLARNFTQVVETRVPNARNHESYVVLVRRSYLDESVPR
jgi:hypothetical protein